MGKGWKHSLKKHLSLSRSSQPQETAEQAEERKIGEMAKKVCFETLLVDGDRSQEWAIRAVQIIVKTTKKYRCFDQFYEAVMTESLTSPCCPARNDKQPGTFGRTNMFILKLFRFPWLRFDMQTRSTRGCRFPNNKPNNRQACLNPWHYLRLEIPRVPVPAIVVNKNADYGEPPKRPNEEEELLKISDEERIESYTIPNVTMKGDEIKCLYERYIAESEFDPRDPLADFPLPSPTDIQSNLALGITSMNGFGPSTSSAPIGYTVPISVYGGALVPFEDPDTTPELRRNQGSSSSSHSGLSSPSSDSGYSPAVFMPERVDLFSLRNRRKEKASTANGGEAMECDSGRAPPQVAVVSAEEQKAAEEFESIPAELTPIQSVDTKTEGEAMEQGEEPDEPFEDEKHLEEEDEKMEEGDEDETGETPKRKRPTHPDGRPMTPSERRPLFRSSPSELAELARKAAATYECVEYSEQANWLSLIYYEEAVQVGEIKEFTRQHCLIDGYTSSDDTGTRFSVGFYTNPKRAQISSDVRSLIGKGVRLYLIGGEVYIENLCSIPVFVQSISANMKNGFQLNTVSKLPPYSTMKVFDMRQFAKQLAAAAEKTYNDVYALSRMCSIRISFCKGWGEHYRRSTVLRSPVWFQAHLHSPMHWIESVLLCMGAPPRLCSSRT